MAFGDKYIPGMISRAGGVSVAIGSASTNGLVEYTDEVEYDPRDGTSQVVGEKVIVQIQTGSLAGLARNATIVVDGVSLKVQDFKRIEDGKMTAIECVVKQTP